MAPEFKVTRQSRFIKDEPNEEPIEFLRDHSGIWTADETQALTFSSENARECMENLHAQDVRKEYIYDYSSVSE